MDRNIKYVQLGETPRTYAMFDWGREWKGGENGKVEKEKREEDEIFHYLVGVKREMKENRVGGVFY